MQDHGLDDHLGMDQPTLDGDAYQTRHVVRVQLLHQVGPVRIHRAWTDEEAFADLPIPKSFGQRCEHFDLAIAEPGEQRGVPPRAGTFLQECIGDAAAEIASPFMHLADRQ